MESKSYYTLPRPVLTVLLCLTSFTLNNVAQTIGHLTVGQPRMVAGKRNASVQAKIPVSVQPGFHVNSNTPGDEYLIPLKLTWKATGALEAGAIVYPKPAQEQYEFSEKPLSVYTGNFDLLANFKVTANAEAGPGVAVGQLRYQACDNKACYPPKTVEVSVSYQVQ